jgi:hypothetical protein
LHRRLQTAFCRVQKAYLLGKNAAEKVEKAAIKAAPLKKRTQQTKLASKRIKLHPNGNLMGKRRLPFSAFIFPAYQKGMCLFLG